MTITASLFGYTEFALRLPNVLAFFLYAWFCLKILGLSKSSFIKLVSVAICLLNPYLIEFFSLARGYAFDCPNDRRSLLLLERGVKGELDTIGLFEDCDFRFA